MVSHGAGHKVGHEVGLDISLEVGNESVCGVGHEVFHWVLPVVDH